jgi:hypothetical protein
VIGVWASAPDVRAAGPADGLLRLVPPNSGMTLAVEDLRGHFREIDNSPLLNRLRRIGAYRAWLASERFRTLDRAGRDVEAALRVPLSVIRDEIVGDAVVLSLMPGPAARPEDARGLLLALPRDRTLVEPMMKSLNEVQSRSGELLGAELKTRGPVSYSVRKYKAAGRPAEYYVLLDGGVFAWSNSEEMIFGVIDRKLSGGKSLVDDPAFEKVRRGLPERAMASLFLNPRLLDRAMDAVARPAKPGEERLGAMLARYIGAVGYAGVSLQWRDGLFLHTHEAIDPAKLDPWLRRWLSGPSAPVSLPGLVPESALAIASIQVNYEAALEALSELVPEDDRPRLENLRLALQGVLLGRDPVTEVLPRLDPGALFYVESGSRFPLVAALGWKDQAGAPDLAAPLDNALRTMLAFYALDAKHVAAHLRVETRTIGEARVTTLTDGLRPRLSYRVDRGRIVLGNVPEEVARFGIGPPPSFLTNLRARYFPEAATFVVIDLGRLVREIRNLRGPIATQLAARSKRPVDAVDRDLGQLLALADLFWAATFTSAAAPDASEIHRTIGLLAR